MSEPCVHEWRRVGPVVYPLTTVPELKGFPTYNAVCAKCDEVAWLHWPEPRYPYRQETGR